MYRLTVVCSDGRQAAKVDYAHWPKPGSLGGLHARWQLVSATLLCLLRCQALLLLQPRQHLQHGRVDSSRRLLLGRLLRLSLPLRCLLLLQKLRQGSGLPTRLHALLHDGRGGTLLRRLLLRQQKCLGLHAIAHQRP